MWPALQKLRASGKYILAALSNTVIFPPSHPYSTPAAGEDVRGFFDVFISSAHVGLRKPDPAIYKLALREVDKWSREKGKGGVEPGEVLFLDDIGENLKAGKQAGFGTVKVRLGRAYEAVDELERVTGLKLAGNAARVPAGPGEVRRGAKL
jgi:FMN phosphatase YigB (HAD superfamily)